MRTRNIQKTPADGDPPYQWGGEQPAIMQKILAEQTNRFYPLKGHFENPSFGVDALTPRFSEFYGKRKLSPLQAGLLDFIIRTSKGGAQTLEDLLKPATLFSQKSIVSGLNLSGSGITTKIVDPDPSDQRFGETLPRHIGYRKEPIRQSDIAQHFAKLEEKGAIQFLHQQDRQKLFCVSAFYAIWYTIRQQGSSSEVAQEALSYSLGQLRELMLEVDPKYPGLELDT